MARAIKIISLAAVILLAVLAVPFPLTNVARATCYSEVWVAPPPLGNDANPGTQAAPFATIQHGINVTCNGSTVHVAAGTYHQNLVINSGQNLAGAGAPTTFIDGSDCGPAVFVNSEPVSNTISGFTIQNGSLLSSNWDPAKEQVLYAGIKLPSFKTSPFHFGLSCGGGVYIGETHIVTLNDCVIKDNNAEVGGGICNYGQLYMNRCTVSGNIAAYRGGGIYNNHSSSMWLTNCTISGNSAIEGLAGPGQQAPIFGAAIVNASEIDGNGGGIYNSGTMELLNCTIANNSAEGYGGGFSNVSPVTAIFKNTIVANNTAGEPGTNNCFNGEEAVITSLGHNLDSENTCQFNGTGDLINTDPLLGPLQDNGGPTFTHALLDGSPAIDAGDNSGAPATDQRGITRPQGSAVDIGAYELVPSAAPATTSTHPSVSPSTTNWTRNLNPPIMSVQFMSINPQQTYANQPVTISTNVVNTGDEGGNLYVTLKIDGQVEQTRMVSVGPKATQPIKFTITKAQPGTYNVAILDQSSSFTIVGDAGTARAPVNGGLIAILVIGMLVLASVMVLLLSRRPA